MAKVSYTNLKLKKIDESKPVNFNGQTIEIKQYLPVNEKLEICTSVVNNAVDGNNFVNPLKVDVFTDLEILYHYTNINFTDKQKEDFLKLYDTCEENGLIEKVISGMDPREYEILIQSIEKTMEGYFTYKNSVYGILEATTNDYNNVDLNVENIMKKLNNAEGISLVKDITTKLD